MKKTVLSSILHSISVQLLTIIIITVVPLISLLIYNNMHSRSILLEQIESTHRNMLQSYLQQVENQLDLALAYSTNLALYHNDPQIINTADEDSPRQYATSRIYHNMTDQLLTNFFIDGFFLSVPDTGGYVHFIHSSSFSQIPDPVKDTVRGMIEDNSPNVRWEILNIEGTEYILLLVNNGSHTWSGGYIKLDDLVSRFSPSTMSDSKILLLSQKGTEELSASLDSQQQMVSFSLPGYDITMAETFNRNDALNSLPFMQKYTILITVMLIVLVATLLLLIQKLVAFPLMKLAQAMSFIQNGDLEYRLPDTSPSTEIGLINRTFNRMASEIQNLKINVYEEKLKAQRSQLQNLQMQIKPHFLVNSLNMIYNLIETRSYSLAQKLIQHSIDYFRYMMKVDDDLVPLEEEIQHTRSYLEIQSIRYKDRFTYHISVDPMISDILIPPVLIQNMVENSMKYALSTEELLHVDIRITSFEEDYVPYARIVIADNGTGYPPEDLPLLNHGKKILREDGPHIGISNSIQRLNLIFEGKASWHFQNSNGAVSEIIVPARFLPEPEDIFDEILC